MARIDTTINPIVKVFPLQIAQQLVQQNSGFPRAVVEAKYDLQAYTGPGAGNNLQLYFQYSLPKNYAYAYLGFTMAISTFTTSSANSFETPYHEIANESFPVSGDGQQWVQPVEAVQIQRRSDPLDEQFRVFSDRPDTRTDSIVFNTKSEEPTVRAYALNLTDNSGNGNVYYRARFLQYDISQAFSFPVNFSIPTR